MTRAPRGTVRRGAVYAAASQAVAVAALALTNVVVARALGPSGTGQFNVLITIVLLATVLAPLGLDYGITYFVGGGRWAPGAALRKTQAVAAVVSSAMAALLWIVPSVLVDELYGGLDAATVLVALAAIPFAVSWTLTAAVGLAVADYRTYALAPIAQAVGLVLLATSGAIAFGIGGAATGVLAANVGAAVLTARSLKVADAEGGSWRELRAAGRYGLPITVANGLGLVNRRADLLVVAAVLGSTEAGPYAVALAISSVQVILPRALAAVVLPRVAADAREASGADAVLARSSRHAVILACATGLAAAAATPLIPLVYGEGFRPAIELTLLLVPGSIAYGIGSVLTAGIMGQGRSLFPLVSTLLTAPPTVAAYVVTAHAFGATGTAIASSASYTVSGLLAAAYCMRVRPLGARRLFVPRRDDWDAYRRLLGSMVRALPRKA